PRLAHQLEGQGVHVAVLRADPRIPRRDVLEPVLPDFVRGDRVGLVAHGDAGLAVGLRPLERRADDALDARGGVDLLGDVRLPFDSTLACVDPLGVLAKNDEIDGRTVGRSDSLTVESQWGEIRMEKLNGSEVDELVQLEAQPQQNVPGVFVAGDARIAYGPEEDGVRFVPQFPKRPIR